MIEKLYAVLGVGPDGVEGVATYIDPRDNVTKPLLSGDEKGAQRLVEVASQLQKDPGTKLQLVVFTGRNTLMVINE